jgi:hypothetical protein
MRRHFGAAVATASIALCAASGAKAAYDPIAEAETTITFAKPFAADLAKHGVKVSVREGRRQGSKIMLSSSGGEIDPRLGLGTVESNGTVVFQVGKQMVLFRRLVFKAKRAPLYAKVGGGQLKIATGARLLAKRSGFGMTFTASGLRLSAKVATRLNKKLHLGHTLAPGQLLGTVKVNAQPRTVHLKPEDRVYLALDAAFKAKLDQLFVSFNPIAPAELSSGPTLSFPVGLESTLAPDGRSGTVKFGGQVELLQLGSAQMFWREVWLEPEPLFLLAETDVEPAPPHPGVAPQGPLLSLSNVSATSDSRSLAISVASQDVALTGATADSLDAAFGEGRHIFSAGERVGALSLSARAE